MEDTPSSKQNPFEAWSKLIEDTMKGSPVAQTATGPAQRGEEDPWITFIDQLWKDSPSSKLLPLDPAEITRAFQQIWLNAISNPDRAWAHYTNFVQQYTQAMAAATLKFWGYGEDVEPVTIPEKDDKRFSAPDWQQNPVFDMLKQSYLLAAITLLKSSTEIEGLNEKQQRKLVFYLRQFLDAISPSNFTFTNPLVLHEPC